MESDQLYRSWLAAPYPPTSSCCRRGCGTGLLVGRYLWFRLNCVTCSVIRCNVWKLELTCRIASVHRASQTFWVQVALLGDVVPFSAFPAEFIPVGAFALPQRMACVKTHKSRLWRLIHAEQARCPANSRMWPHCYHPSAGRLSLQGFLRIFTIHRKSSYRNFYDDSLRNSSIDSFQNYNIF